MEELNGILTNSPTLDRIVSVRQQQDLDIVTLLVCDLVDSTGLVERIGDAEASSLMTRFEEICRSQLREFGGKEIDKTDGFLLLFKRPINAIAYALELNERLYEASSTNAPMLLRTAIHLGEVALRKNPPDYVKSGAKPIEADGLAKSIAARVCSIAKPKQILITRGAFDLGRRASVGSEPVLPQVQWRAHGFYKAKGVSEPMEIFEVGIEGFAPLTAPEPTEKCKPMDLVESEPVLGWRPAPGLLVPKRESWRLEDKIGEGGFGEVWLARHPKTQDPRVFKFCFNKDRVRGLQREVAIARVIKENLGHRHDISKILEWEFKEPPYFIEMEFTEGGSLLDWSNRAGGISKIPIEVRLRLAAEIAVAINASHQAGVLHKDIKPSNVLIHFGPDRQPYAVLTDFGIGLLEDKSILEQLGITQSGFTNTLTGTQTSSRTGTQLYMAPELFKKEKPSRASDWYSFGVLLFQLAAGDFQKTITVDAMAGIRSRKLRIILEGLLAENPSQRLEELGNLPEQLRQLGKKRYLPSLPSLLISRKHFLMIGGFSLVLLTLIGGGYYYLVDHDKDTSPPDTSPQISEMIKNLKQESDPQKIRTSLEATISWFSDSDEQDALQIFDEVSKEYKQFIFSQLSEEKQQYLWNHLPQEVRLNLEFEASIK